jgi:AraC-like DNA-binding protein
MVAFAQWVSGSTVQPLKVQFSQSPIGPPGGYHAVFHCPVEFDQAFSGVLLDNAVLDAPLPQANAQLAQVHQQHAAARLAALSPPETLVQDLRRWIATQLHGQLPSRAKAAQALGLSPRTLARRMQAQQLDFSTLVDQARRNAALHAVANTRQALSAIGQSLGFAEPSTFWRAFKRWTGQTPAKWRLQQPSGGEV